MRNISFTILLFLSIQMQAQKSVGIAKVKTDIVASNEPFLITLTINKRADKVVMPDLSNFTVLAEPTSSKTISEEQGDGDQSIEIVTQTYTCAIVPKMAGKFTIQPFTFIVKGEEVKSNELKIKVEDRKISWQDSADVASDYSNFSIGSQATAGVPTKTAIDYNKADKTLVPKEEPIGNGVPSFDITPSKTSIKVKAGEDFIVEYKIYKEAPKDEFKENVELMAMEGLKDFTLVDGPARHLKVQSNSTTKIQSGTADLILEAPMKAGKYTLPSLRAKYGDVIVTSPAIEVIVE